MCLYWQCRGGKDCCTEKANNRHIFGKYAISSLCCLPFCVLTFVIGPDYVPTVLDNSNFETIVDGHACRLELYDTAGNEEHVCDVMSCSFDNSLLAGVMQLLCGCYGWLVLCC